MFAAQAGSDWRFYVDLESPKDLVYRQIHKGHPEREDRLGHLCSGVFCTLPVERHGNLWCRLARSHGPAEAAGSCQSIPILFWLVAL